MSSLIASRRYASALLTAAVEGNFLDQIVREFEEIKEVLHNSRDLTHTLRSPVVNGDKKIKILEEIFKDSVGDQMFVFLRLVTRKKRAGQLPEIIDEFQILLDERMGVVNAAIVSAVTLSDEQSADLVARLESYTGKRVRATMSTNAAFIGGVSVKIGDTIFDGTISHQLTKLRETLVSETA
ncbi:MAG: F0F1 ATP synthase subunit delta [Chlorobium sp.]|jgi:F-type H+-transporting ATPase subunit delta|nr:F0F1 ATP synthase subunit delta [Chlorobium sp.]